MRFTSPHPKDFPEKLLDAVAEHPKICKHIHLPAQAGNDRVLAMMNRTYTCTEYRKLVEQILTRCPQIVLTTDIIAGFCSEADDEYKETYRLLEDIRFASAYVFKYSERKHTIAARKFADDVSEQVKSERVTQLIELQRGISLAYNLGMIGEVMEILVEGEGKRADQWMGRTDGNIVTVFPKTHGTLKPGSLISVRIVDATVTTLYGESALS